MTHAPEDTHSPRETHGELVAPIVRALRSIRARARTILVGARAAKIIAVTLFIVIAAGLVDSVLRTPGWLRIVLWLIGLGALIVGSWRLLRPALAFKPSLTEIALRLERARPELKGTLASALDFSKTGGPTAAEHPMTRALEAHVVTAAARAWQSTGREVLDDSLRTVRLRRGLAYIAAGLAAAAGLYFASPAMWTIGAQRVLLPWTGAQWPKRTGVYDLTSTNVHPLGAALPLQAAVKLRRGEPNDKTYAAVRYRTITRDAAGERAGPERRELLTWQNREAEAPTEPGEPIRRGQLFERLIEPAGSAVEYRFETDDDQTDWRRVELVEPPRVIEARATITPPEYARAISNLKSQISNEASPERAGGVDTSRESHGSDTPNDPAADDGIIHADLGPGTDDRALAPAALEGSLVELSITLNKPVEPPTELIEAIRASEAAEAGTPVRLEQRAERWTISWTLRQSARLPMRLIDEHGIESPDEAAYRFEAAADRPASATITEPSSDRTVLPTARVRVVAEGRDDVGLSNVSLERAHWTPAARPGSQPSGPGGAMEPSGEPSLAATQDIAGDRTAAVETTLELSTLDLKPGDELRLTALARDLFAFEGKSRDATRSAPRLLRIISEEQFVEELRKQLAEVRQSAIRVDEQQEKLRERTEQSGADRQNRRGQGQISERLARTRDAVQRLIQRAEENNLADDALQDLLGGASEALTNAGQASSRAAKALDEAGERAARSPPREEKPRTPGESPNTPDSDSKRDGESNETPAGEPSSDSPSDKPSGSPQSAESGRSGQSGQSGESGQSGQSGQSSPQQPQKPGESPTKPSEPRADDERDEKSEPSDAADPADAVPLDEKSREEVAQAQERVKEELGQLIEMLDRGEDNWVVKNTIERLAREQRELQEQTRRTGARTAGRSPEELSQQERSELQQIAEKQEQLANAAKRLEQDMKQREQALREKDPASAAGMAQARQRLEREQVAQQMQNAGQSAQQNQTSTAQQQQQQAAQSLEQMLQDMEESQKARDEQLKRMLASIIETIEGLVQQQTQELARLDAAAENQAALRALDQGMIRMNQNTLAAVDTIRAAGPEAAAIGSFVSRAADAQQRAIRELRPAAGDDIKPAEVRTHENQSLEFLKQALAKAQESKDDAEEREQRRKMAELKQFYRQMLEQQVALRAETEPFTKIADLSRRDRVLVRKLGERQAEIRAEIKALLEKTKELTEAKVFEHAHQSLDRHLDRAVGSLADAKPAGSLRPQDQAIGVLKGILEALTDPKDDQKFSEQQSASSGGGGGAQGEQPLIPPAKELRLLKGLMTDLAEQTSTLSNEEKPDDAALNELGDEHRRLTDIAQGLIERLERRPAPTLPQPGAEPPVPEPKEPGPGEPAEPKEPDA